MVVFPFVPVIPMIWIEPKSSGLALLPLLSQMEYGGYATRKISGVNVQMGKESRVRGIEAVVAGGKLRLLEGNWNGAYINECVSFPRGKHDEMIRACQGL